MLIQCGYCVVVVVMCNLELVVWVQGEGLWVEDQDVLIFEDVFVVDWLFSVVNLLILKLQMLVCGQKGVINFYDGLLLCLVGLNVLVWVIIGVQLQYGIIWYLIEGGVDEGDILVQCLFDLCDDDIVLMVNVCCFVCVVESFFDVVVQFEGVGLQCVVQDLMQCSYVGKDKCFEVVGVIDFNQFLVMIGVLVCGLDYGGYWNFLIEVKVLVGDCLLLVMGFGGVVVGLVVLGMVILYDGEMVVIVMVDGVVCL